MARGPTYETENCHRSESAFFAEHIANPLHAVLDGTLNGTNWQTQPKARERTHRGPTRSPYAHSVIMTPMQANNHNYFVTGQT